MKKSQKGRKKTEFWKKGIAFKKVIPQEDKGITRDVSEEKN
jgi:hypothetical protein